MPKWTADLVEDRLVDAFRILIRLPEKDRPRKLRSMPLPVMRDLDDLLGAEEIRDKAKFNWPKIPCSPREISLMDEAIYWPAQYLAGDGAALRAVQVSACARGFGKDVRRLMKRHGIPSIRALEQARKTGAAMIAAALNRDAVAVRALDP